MRTGFVVRVADARERVGADVGALVPLQDHWQRPLHPLRRNLLLVNMSVLRNAEYLLGRSVSVLGLGLDALRLLFGSVEG